jgi:hypothetical protein
VRVSTQKKRRGFEAQDAKAKGRKTERVLLLLCGVSGGLCITVVAAVEGYQPPDSPCHQLPRLAGTTVVGRKLLSVTAPGTISLSRANGRAWAENGHGESEERRKDDARAANANCAKTALQARPFARDPSSSLPAKAALPQRA